MLNKPFSGNSEQNSKSGAINDINNLEKKAAHKADKWVRAISSPIRKPIKYATSNNLPSKLRRGLEPPEKQTDLEVANCNTGNKSWDMKFSANSFISTESDNNGII